MALPPKSPGATVSLKEAISFTPRHEMHYSTPDEKKEELQKVGAQLAGVVVEFARCHGAEIFQGAQAAFQEVARVMRSYPEICLLLEGFTPRAGSTKNFEERELQQLSLRRAEAVRNKLMELGAINDITVDGLGSKAAQGKPHGFVTFAASVDVELKPPQQRLDFVLNRCFFEFVAQSEDFTEKGNLVADTVTDILKESTKKVLITCPKGSSQLALRRADAIVKALYDRGVEVEILVKIAIGDQKLVTIAIDESQPEEDPQRVLADILRETPFAFKANGVELMPEVLTCMGRVAEVLKDVRYMMLQIETYSGIQNELVTEQKAVEIMTERSRRLARHLQNLGVTIPMVPRGVAGPCLVDGSGDVGPRVILTLLNEGEEDEEDPYPTGDVPVLALPDKASRERQPKQELEVLPVEEAMEVLEVEGNTGTCGLSSKQGLLALSCA